MMAPVGAATQSLTETSLHRRSQFGLRSAPQMTKQRTMQKDTAAGSSSWTDQCKETAVAPTALASPAGEVCFATLIQIRRHDGILM